MKARLTAVGCGAVTAVGFSAPQTCAAVRGGISGFRASRILLRRKRYATVVGANVPFDETSDTVADEHRLARMASDAIGECLEYAALDPSTTAVFIGVREPLGNPIDEARRATLLARVATQCRARFHRESSLIVGGNCSIAIGLDRAATLLAAGAVHACIVGGVDSYLTPQDIEWYDRFSRVKAPGNSRGFIPGEAAAFVAVATRGNGRGFADILGVGMTQENRERIAVSDGYPTGHALTSALAAAVDDAGIEEKAVEFRVTDLNGERYGAQDSILGSERFYRTIRPTMPMICPAASVGETGAAAGALGVLLASVAIAKGYAPGRLGMCEAASDGGLRSGVVVAAKR